MDVRGRAEPLVTRTSKPLPGILGDVGGRIVPIAPPTAFEYELDSESSHLAREQPHVSGRQHASCGQRRWKRTRRPVRNDAAGTTPGRAKRGDSRLDESA